MFSYAGLAIVTVLFALAYQPALVYFSLNFVTSYTRADNTKRAFAATIDALLLATCVLLYRYSGAPVFLVAGAGYLLERDAVRGQSLGKFCLGLTVISVETGRPAGAASSARRNLLFLVPGANIAAVFLGPSRLPGIRRGSGLGIAWRRRWSKGSARKTRETCGRLVARFSERAQAVSVAASPRSRRDCRTG